MQLHALAQLNQQRITSSSALFPMQEPTTTEIGVINAPKTPEVTRNQGDNNHDHPSDLDYPSLQLGFIQQDELTPVVLIKKNPRTIARRHSTLGTSGMVLPIQEEHAEERTSPEHVTKLKRRRSTQRGLVNKSKPLLAGLGRAGMKTHHVIGNSSTTATFSEMETPYEEMMVRFQIRQLQHTPSGLSSLFDEKINSFASSRGVDTSRSNDGRASMTNALTDEEDQAEEPLQRSRYSVSSTHDGNTNVQSLTPMSRASSSAFLSDADQRFKEPPVARDQGWIQTMHHNAMRIWQKHVMTPISPFSKFSQARYMVIMVTAITYVVFFPLGFAFPAEQKFAYVDGVVGVLFCLDVLITLHTSYLTKNGNVVNSHRAIAWHYLTTRFVLDAFLAIPLIVHGNCSTWMHFALDVISAERLAYVARLVRLVWVMRLNQSGRGGHTCWAWLLYSRYSHLLRIAAIVTVLVAIAHYNACIWTVLLREGDEFQDPTMPWQDQYSASFFAALLLLQGEGVPTDTTGQNVFASLSTLMGSIVLAVVFGHVAILVSNFNANFTNYQRKMEAVVAMTAKLQLPPPLRERIHEYYEHLWHEYECLDGEVVQFSKELSHTLGLEVVLFKYMELVMHVPFWKDCTPDFQKQLMLRLDVRVYLPDDFIMRHGEVDDEFYMVNRGYCEQKNGLKEFERVTASLLGADRGSNTVGTARSLNTHRGSGGLTSHRRSSGLNSVSIDDGHRQSAYELDAAQRRYYSNIAGRRGAKGFQSLITRGQAFGDLALLTNYERAADVRAITHVEMCVLSRDDFQAILTRYPDDRHNVVVDMLTSYMQSYEMSQSHCPLLDLVRNVYSPEAIAEACAKAGGAPPLLPPILTARQAAERIYMAINIETEDTTLKFGVGANVREQLIELRERRRQKREMQRQAEVQKSRSTNIVTTSSNAFNGRLGSERISEENDFSSKSTCEPPVLVADQVESQAKHSLTLKERLRQVEEREVAILRAMQELQASFELLQARRFAADSISASTTTPPSVRAPQLESGEVSRIPRKRSAPGADTPFAAPPTTTGSRPRLLQRMGSLVGLSSGSTLDKRANKTPQESPTRYADQLFHAHVTSTPQSPQDQPLQCTRPHNQQISRAATLSMLFSERSLSQRTTETSTTTNLNSSQGPNSSVTKVEQDLRRKIFQRTHSQTLQSLTEEVAPSNRHGSIGSSPSPFPPGRLFRRLSPAASEPRESPTRYADALFRPREISRAIPSDGETTSAAEIGSHENH